MSDQMDLLVEQVKMLAGEIAFSTSTLKRLVDQSVDDPESSKAQVHFAVLCSFSFPFIYVLSQSVPIYSKEDAVCITFKRNVIVLTIEEAANDQNVLFKNGMLAQCERMDRMPACSTTNLLFCFELTSA